jgi:hypothetical protein
MRRPTLLVRIAAAAILRPGAPSVQRGSELSRRTADLDLPP